MGPAAGPGGGARRHRGLRWSLAKHSRGRNRRTGPAAPSPPRLPAQTLPVPAHGQKRRGSHPRGLCSGIVCRAGSEGRGDAGPGLGRGWGGPGGGAPETLSAGREGEPRRQPLGDTGTPGGKAQPQSDAATSRLRAIGARSLLGHAPGKAGGLEAVFFR